MAKAKDSIQIGLDFPLDELINTMVDQTSLRAVLLGLDRVCRARAAKNYARAGESGEERFHALGDSWLLAAAMIVKVQQTAKNDEL